jgi:hypothetical protein
MLEAKEPLTRFIILSYFVGFIAGIFCAAFYQYLRHNAPEAWNARLAAAEGEPRHDGKKRSMNVVAAVVLGLIVVSGVIAVDQFMGPLFPDAFYFLGQLNAEQSRDVTVRRPSPMDVRGDDGGDD